MTKLSKAVRRVAVCEYGAIALTIAPGKNDTLVGLRKKGRRTGYILRLTDMWRLAALWHGQKEKAAKAKARKDGIHWRKARKQFEKENRL